MYLSIIHCLFKWYITIKIRACTTLVQNVKCNWERTCDESTNSTLLFLTELVKSTYFQRTQMFSTSVFTDCLTGSLPAKGICLLYVPNAVSVTKPIISRSSTDSMIYVVEMDGFLWGRDKISDKFPSSNGSYLTPVYLYISFNEVSCRQFFSPKRHTHIGRLIP